MWLDMKKEFVIQIALRDSFTKVPVSQVAVTTVLNGSTITQTSNSMGLVTFRSTNSGFDKGSFGYLQIADPAEQYINLNRFIVLTDDLQLHSATIELASFFTLVVRVYDVSNSKN